MTRISYSVNLIGRSVLGPSPLPSEEQRFRCWYEFCEVGHMVTAQPVRDVWESGFEEITVEAFLDGAFRLIELVRADAICRAVFRRQRSAARLSPRERCVIERLIGGSSQKAISYELGLALTTVSVHLRVALDKLGLRRWEHPVLAPAVLHRGRMPGDPNANPAYPAAVGIRASGL